MVKVLAAVLGHEPELVRGLDIFGRAPALQGLVVATPQVDDPVAAISLYVRESDASPKFCALLGSGGFVEKLLFPGKLGCRRWAWNPKRGYVGEWVLQYIILYNSAVVVKLYHTLT